MNTHTDTNSSEPLKNHVSATGARVNGKSALNRPKNFHPGNSISQAIVTPSQKAISKAKLQMSCKISRLVKALIALERKNRNCSEGEALESLVIRASNSLEAENLILREAESNPLLAAVCRVLMERKSNVSGHSGASGDQIEFKS